MTGLALPDNRLEITVKRVSDAASLRAWLANRWAILFSHAEDFAQEQLEMDRWVSVLSRSFDGRDVSAVALARAGRDPEQDWPGRLAALGPGCAAVLTPDPAASPVADLATGALRALIARSGPRFAMILDSNLRCRRALSYRPPAELPSPLDLIGWAVALRRRDGIAPGSRETAEPARPMRCIRNPLVTPARRTFLPLLGQHDFPDGRR